MLLVRNSECRGYHTSQSAHVLLTLLDELMIRSSMMLCRTFYNFFAMGLINSIKQKTKLSLIYHRTLNLSLNHVFFA